jgi:hypothetical protein
VVGARVSGPGDLGLIWRAVQSHPEARRVAATRVGLTPLIKGLIKGRR